MIRVLIADDHAIVRQGLKQIVEESGEMRVVAEAANGADALYKMREIACDVVLLDISMPGKSGIEVLKQIKEEKPRLPVLILSIYPEDQYAVRLIKSGAAGYMTKETAPMEVVEAVRRVASGKKYISPTVAEMLANDMRAEEGTPAAPELVVEEVMPLDLAVARYARSLTLRLTKAGLEDELLAAVKKALDKHPGRIPVLLRLEAPTGAPTLIETDEKVALTDGLFEQLGKILGDKAWKIESAS